ncbi:hypothetical protein MP228_003658 [Amoeboaphelidium protococcarum]|nr:hypothetical protein MP228_003658 [Amoeboaphelidium protococcarum]
MKFIIVSSLIAMAYAYDLSTAVNEGEKSQLCLSNQYACSNFCSGSASTNTCDSFSMKWNCLCSSTGKFPTVQPVNAFPVEIAQCNGAVLECIDQCLASNPSGASSCSAQCKRGFCGSVQALQSKSFVEIPAPPPSNADKDKSSDASESIALSALGVFSVLSCTIALSLL